MDNEKAIAAIKRVEDPELGLDVYTLGLIYEIKEEDKKLKVKMTFTSPMCPYGPQLMNQIADELRKEGFDPEIEIVFDPVWKPSEEVKMLLGLA